MAVHFQLFLPSCLTQTTVHFELIFTMEIFWILWSHFCDGFSMYILYDIGWIESCHLDWCLSVLVHVCWVYCNHFLWRHQWSIWILLRGKLSKFSNMSFHEYQNSDLANCRKRWPNQFHRIWYWSSYSIRVWKLYKKSNVLVWFSVHWSLIHNFQTLTKVIHSGR